MDTDSFVLSVNKKDIMIDLKNFEDLLDLTNSNETHELSIKRSRKTWKNLKYRFQKIFA